MRNAETKVQFGLQNLLQMLRPSTAVMCPYRHLVLGEIARAWGDGLTCV
jgi:hypothetical protein